MAAGCFRVGADCGRFPRVPAGCGRWRLFLSPSPPSLATHRPLGLIHCLNRSNQFVTVTVGLNIPSAQQSIAAVIDDHMAADDCMAAAHSTIALIPTSVDES